MAYNNKRWQLLLLICLFCITLFAYAQLPVSVGFNQQLNSGEIPDGLSASDWANIQAQFKAEKYKAYQDDNGSYHSSNPAYGWQIHYAVDGTTTLSPRDREAAAYQLGLKLTAIGYDMLESLHHPQQISSQDNTLDYHWNDILTERWVNSETDLEQWFFLAKRPAGANRGRFLTLQMTLNSTLSASQHGNSLRFTSSFGTTITYNKLKVWDANGRSLTAQMQLDAQHLSLIIDDSKAVYPLTIDPSFQQQSYLKASNTQANDNFGISVAISGDTMVVGAFGESSNATGVNGNQSDHSASGAGAAYVFTRSGNTWNQQAYLKASNSQQLNFFGSSVAIAGDTVVVGAFGEFSNATGVNGNQNDSSAGNSGAAYVFIRSGNTWSQQAYLKASNTDAFDQFGSSVAIAGDTVVVSADREASNASGVNGNQNNNSAPFSGAAYVFSRNGSTWSQQAYLKASNTEVSDHFGSSVAITGDTIVVGADREASNATGVGGDQNNNSATGAGAVYVFSRSGNTWSQQAYLKASNTGALDQFGSAIAIAGDTLVVGADREASNTTGINGDQSNNSADAAGAAYVFSRNGNNWSQQAYLKASNTDAFDQFGSSVAIAGDTVVVSADREASNASGVNGNQNNNSAPFSGAAYVFSRNGNNWSQQAYLKASNTGAFDQFGLSVAIADDTVVIGAFNEDSNVSVVNGNQSNNSTETAGAAYVFTRNAGAWSQQDYLKSSNTGAFDQFGSSVAIVGNTAVVGANGEASNATGIDGDQSNNSAVSAGATYVFNLAASATAECTLDVDNNGNTDALTDGLLIIRHLFGIRNESLIANAVATNCSFCSAAEIELYLDQCAATGISDIDGNGNVDALSDGLLAIRYLFGNRGQALIIDSVGDGCSRCTAVEIEDYLQKLMP